MDRPAVCPDCSSRFTVSFHIIFPSFTIGLAAWLTVLEALYLSPASRSIAVCLSSGSRSSASRLGWGLFPASCLAFEFGTNWSRLSEATGPIQGPLLTYETFTAFALEASFFGMLMFGRPRVSPCSYLFSTVMVALGTTLQRVLDHGEQQLDAGAGRLRDPKWRLCSDRLEGDHLQPGRLGQISAYARRGLPHGCFLRCRDRGLVSAPAAPMRSEGRMMLRMGLFLAALLIPVQLFFGHLNGDYVHDKQPAKFAAIEARWHDEKPAGEVMIAIPDSAAEANRLELKIPWLGSLDCIGSASIRRRSDSPAFRERGPAACRHSVFYL